MVPEPETEIFKMLKALVPVVMLLPKITLPLLPAAVLRLKLVAADSVPANDMLPPVFTASEPSLVNLPVLGMDSTVPAWLDEILMLAFDTTPFRPTNC